VAGTMDTDRAAVLNQGVWDSIHRQRDVGRIRTHHDVAADLAAGETALSPEQRALLGDVAGRHLLDLGCGDGMELLELARAGAAVVGVDNSPRQLAAAQRAADALGLPCRLVLADLLRLPEDLLQGEFDVVFSAWVTGWIGDLDRWFGAAHRALAPGGVFLLTGGHPLAGFFGEVRAGEAFRRRYAEEGPFVSDSGGPDPDWNPAGDRRTGVEWRWTLGSLVTALARAGFRVTHLVECGEETAQAKYGLPVGSPGAIILRSVKLSLAVSDALPPGGPERERIPGPPGRPRSGGAHG
jgi:SAM-dependent methyltransferase